MKGDIKAEKVSDYVDKVVNIYGYAKTHISLYYILFCTIKQVISCCA